MVEKQLSALIAGEKGKIARIDGNGALRQRLMVMGIVRGAEIAMVRDAPLGDPIEFLLWGYNLTLRRKEAKTIWVEVEG